MKNNKIMATFLAAVLLLVPLTVPAAAASTSFFSDLISSIFDSNAGTFSLGDFSLDFKTIREKLGPIFANNGFDISKISNSSLAEIIAKIVGAENPEDIDWSKFLSGGTMSDDLLKAITQYIVATTPTTAEPTTADPKATTEPTTAPSVSVPTTAAPVEVVTTIVYVYQGARTYVTPSTTAPPEEVYTYSYVEPDTVVVPEITTQTVYSPVVVEDENTTETTGSDGFSVKTVIGIALLVLSLVAVIVVAVILKKNKV